MPQRNLLKLLKLPDTAAQVKLFRKIPPESIDRRLWKALLTVMRRPDGVCSKLLAHVPTINLGVMELILTPHLRPALTPTLLEEVAADPKEKYRGAVAAMIRDTAAMKDELEDERPLPALTSVARLRDLHGEGFRGFPKARIAPQSARPAALATVAGHQGPDHSAPHQDRTGRRRTGAEKLRRQLHGRRGGR